MESNTQRGSEAVTSSISATRLLVPLPEEVRKRCEGHIAKLEARKRWLSDAVHRVAVNFLTRYYDVVRMPTFRVSSMVRRDQRALNRRTVRDMLSQRHFLLRQRLCARCDELGVDYKEVSEAHTSGTCGSCNVYRRVSGKVVTCSQDKCSLRGVALSRDGNASRNILLKNFSTLPKSFLDYLVTLPVVELGCY